MRLADKVNYKKSVIVVCVISLITSIVLIGCGKPQGALVYIHVNHSNSTIQIDDHEPIPYEDFKNPVLLPANLHTITVEYLESGDIETRTVNLLYGYEYQYTFEAFDEAVINVDSPIPANVYIGKVNLGVVPSDREIVVHAGEREIKGELLGFGYRWRRTRQFQTGDSVYLQPGTDKEHGALYVESDSSGASIITSIDDEPMTYEGSVFFPMVEPGVVEISEKFTEGVTHYVDINPGKVTKLSFISDHKRKLNEQNHTLDISKDSSVELYVNWNSGGVTHSVLGKSVSTVSDLKLDQLTPFRVSGVVLMDTQKHFIGRNNNCIHVSSVSGEIPETIEFNLSCKQLADDPDISLIGVQRFSQVSPDGRYFYYEDGILSADGAQYNPLKSFLPGDWDMENEVVTTVGINSGCGIIEARVERIDGMGNPVLFPQVSVEDIIDKELEYKELQAFFISDYELLMVFGIPGRTRLWKLTLDSDPELLLDIDQGMLSSEFFGKRYLVCYPQLESRANPYIYDIDTDQLMNDSNNTPQLTLLENGLVASGFASGRISAGITYEWTDETLTPVWAGLFPVVDTSDLIFVNPALEGRSNPLDSVSGEPTE